MTKKEYAKQLTDYFWDGKNQEYTGIEHIIKSYEMHNKFVAITKDFADNHDKIESPFSKTSNQIYKMAKVLLSETYPKIYNEKFWMERECLKSE